METLLLIYLHRVRGGPPAISHQRPPWQRFTKGLLWSRTCAGHRAQSREQGSRGSLPFMEGTADAWDGNTTSPGSWPVSAELSLPPRPFCLISAPPPHNATSHLRLLFLQSAKGLATAGHPSEPIRGHRAPADRQAGCSRVNEPRRGQRICPAQQSPGGGPTES